MVPRLARVVHGEGCGDCRVEGLIIVHNDINPLLIRRILLVIVRSIHELFWVILSLDDLIKIN